MIQEAPISAPVKQQEITIQEPQMGALPSYVEPIRDVNIFYKNTDTLVYFHRLYKDLTEAFEYVNHGYYNKIFKEKHLKELEKWKQTNYDFYKMIRQYYMDARDKDVNFNLTEQQKFKFDDTTNNIIDSMPLAAKEDEIHWSVQNRYEKSPSEKIAYYIDLLDSIERKGNYAQRNISNIGYKIKELEKRKRKSVAMQIQLNNLYTEFDDAQKLGPAITTDLEYQKRYLQHRIKNLQQRGSGKIKKRKNRYL